MRKALAIILVIIMIISLVPGAALAAEQGAMTNFTLSGRYKAGMFKDVASTAWYAEVVATAYDLGFMEGDDKGFSPNGNVTIAQAVTMAARLHSIYATGKAEFEQGSPWYQVYVDYAEKNGILEKGEFTNFNTPATRAQMVHIFFRALPKAELKEINTVNSLPDVNSTTPYAEDILSLYRAGVLTGNDDKGTFTPAAPIARSQAAAIIARMALPTLRQTLNIDSVTPKLSDAVSTIEIRRTQADIESVGSVTPYKEYWFEGNARITEDLTGASALAYSLGITEKTTFAKLPADYDPAALLEWGKDPGLNMDILHKYGYDGSGAVIAYIDQPIPEHEQYSSGKIHYQNNSGSDNSMHGPAVLSLLAGKDIGVAPDAEVYYYGHAAWKADQTTHAECLYQIIEQNKSLPADKKITMVGFSDNIDYSEENPEALEAAVAACEAAGVMVWFCGENGAASFLPMSDKNNPRNLMAESWGGAPELVYVPASGRTTAIDQNGAEYVYWSNGGLSWTMPYTLGLYAIVGEIDPTLTQDDMRKMIVDTAYDVNGMRIVNPVGFVAAALEGVGRSAEAKALRGEVDARQNYMYAIMDTAAMSKDDLKAVADYLAGITEATVLVCDASSFSDAETLYTELCADAAARGGKVVGVQIFGTAAMVPAFNVKYKVQMAVGVDDAGYFLTDLFYGNFNNNPKLIANDYNVMDHFEQNWDVDLSPDWPVARLPLSKGEFAAFFAKYEDFAEDTGLVRQRLVNFSNPIFNQQRHSDDMGTFLNRMKKDGLLNVDYRLYGNLDGDVPVTTDVLGGFTKANLSKENDAGPMELIVNSHGQWNNIDQCIFEDGEEQRISFINMDDINSVLDGNPYYMDCWTCLNGSGMQNNLTTTAMNGQCVGMFSATTIISNNGVNCEASVSKMKQSNFYYFYYSYLKALNEGLSRSAAFCAAQQAYAAALVADSANGIRSGEGNYQFNLCNLLAYHNFGVIEPIATAVYMADAEGYIAQAGHSVPKDTGNQGGGGGGRNSAKLTLTDGNPVGEAKTLKWTESSELKSGSGTIHSYTAQQLDNGYIRFTVEYTVPEGLLLAVFNPPNGGVFMLHGKVTSGEREMQIFDIKAEDVRAVDSITTNFVRADDDRFFVFLKTSGI